VIIHPLKDPWKKSKKMKVSKIVITMMDKKFNKKDISIMLRKMMKKKKRRSKRRSKRVSNRTVKSMQVNSLRIIGYFQGILIHRKRRYL